MRRPFTSNRSSTLTSNHRARITRDVEEENLEIEKFFKDSIEVERLSGDEEEEFEEDFILNLETEEDFTKEDGSTFPKEDTFNWNRKASVLPEFSIKNIG